MNRMIKCVVLFLCVAVFIPLHQASAKGGWEVGTPLLTPRTGASAVQMHGKIYVLGGVTTDGSFLNTVAVFEPDSNRWYEDRIQSFTFSRHSAAAIAFNDSIYLMGGVSKDGVIIDRVEVYDPLSNTWTEREHMLSERHGHFPVILNNRICIVGGKDDKGDFLPEIEWYLNSGDVWIEANSNLFAQRIWPFFAALDNTLYMFGGFNPFPVVTGVQGNISPDWFFSWGSLEPLNQGRGHGATAVLDNKIFLMGGETFSGGQKDTTDIVEIYNLDTGKIESAEPLLTPRISMSAVTLDDMIYLIGGERSKGGGPQTIVEIYSGSPVSVLDDGPGNPIPTQFAQISGYPNPFNGVITLEVDIPARGRNDITIYDIHGRVVKSLHNGILFNGRHTFQWQGNDDRGRPAASGLYFAVLKADAYAERLKIVYLK